MWMWKECSVMLECDWMRGVIELQWSGSGWKKWGGFFWVADGTSSCVNELS